MVHSSKLFQSGQWEGGDSAEELVGRRRRRRRTEVGQRRGLPTLPHFIFQRRGRSPTELTCSLAPPLYLHPTCATRSSSHDLWRSSPPLHTHMRTLSPHAFYFCWRRKTRRIPGTLGQVIASHLKGRGREFRGNRFRSEKRKD